MKICVVDAFTDTAYKGNQAGVCVLDAFPADRVMQDIAMEMNIAETAFLVKTGKLAYHLRWFTPAVEVNLCGHATLAATHALLEMGAIAAGDKVTYDTMSGKLTAYANAQDLITLDFPILAGSTSAPHTSFKSLAFTACEKNRDNYLIEVPTYQDLLACKPDLTALLDLDLQGLIVTTAKNCPSGYDFASRYFAPSAGIDEDPVTGSAHCFLAPYWAAKLGKNTFRALQASTRTGMLEVAISGNRVLLSGHAVTTLQGTLIVPMNTRKEHAA